MLQTANNSVKSRIFLDKLGFFQNDKLLYDKNLCAVYYDKISKEINSSNGESLAELQTIATWLVGDVQTELADGLWKITLKDKVFVFNKFEDQGGILLTGYLVKKTARVLTNFMVIQQRHIFKISEEITNIPECQLVN